MTWYRFTTTERFTHVRADADSNIAAVRVADGTETLCQPGAASQPLVVFEPAGTEVCIGVASTTAISQLVVEAFPYDGNLGRPTDLGIGRPLSSTGSPRGRCTCGCG